MKLRLSIIAENLRKAEIQVINKQNEDTYINKVVYVRCQSELEHKDISSVIWIFDKRNKNLLKKLEEKGEKSGYCYIICGDEPGESEKIISEVGLIIEEFSQWREHILLKMLEKEDMQSIIDYMAEKVCNPFSLLDDNSFILARSKGHELIPKGTIWDTMKGNYLNIYDFYSPREWKKIRLQMDTAGHSHILYRPEKDAQHIYYSINLYDHDVMIGSIGAMDINGPFTDGQLAVMEMIRDMLEVYFRTEYNAVESGSIITTSFNRLLNGDYDLNAIRKSLNKRHWKLDEDFYLLTFEFSDITRSEMELASFMNLIHMQYPKAMVGLKNKQIVISVRKKDYDQEDKKQRESLKKFLVQYDFYCGISYPFKNFENAQYFCEQSCYAALTASQNTETTDGMYRIVEYRDVHIKHAVNMIAHRDEARKYCHPAILMLHESEKKSDQVLVPCLQSFLVNGRSIAHAAKALQLHRNTLIYRLQRLEEILGIHFEYLENDEIMGLLMSCYIVELL